MSPSSHLGVTGFICDYQRQDCAGSWTACTAACEVAAVRTWTETAPRVGAGKACPEAADCRPAPTEEHMHLPLLAFALSRRPLKPPRLATRVRKRKANHFAR